MTSGTFGRGRAAGVSMLAAVVSIWAAAAHAEQLRPQVRPDGLQGSEEVTPAVALVAPIEPMSDIATVPDEVLSASVPAAFEAPTIGPETNLPLPRFVSLKTERGNVRRGPSLSHRIDWVFLRRGMPLQIVAEYGHWRRVVDREGIGGWINYALVSGHRTAIVDAERLMVRARADLTSTEVAEFEAGVIASVEECVADFCYIEAGGYGGWAPKTSLWGIGADEILD